MIKALTSELILKGRSVIGKPLRNNADLHFRWMFLVVICPVS